MQVCKVNQQNLFAMLIDFIGLNTKLNMVTLRFNDDWSGDKMGLNNV